VDCKLRVPIETQMRSNAISERMGNEATRQKMELKFRKVLQSEVIDAFCV